MAGPPTKYRADFPARALDLMRNGASLCEVAADLGVSFETLNKWRKDDRHAKFGKALDLGVDLAQAWWERLGRAGAAGKVDVQPALWIFTMKNRFRWSDRTETEVTGKGGGAIAISWPLPKTALDE